MADDWDDGPVADITKILRPPSNVPSGSPLGPSTAIPNLPAAAPVQRGGGVSLKPTAPKIPEHVMSREEKVAAQIPADKLDLPYRMDENGNISLPPGTAPEKGKEGEAGAGGYSVAAIDSFNRAIETGQRLLAHPGLGAAVGSALDPASYGQWNPLAKAGTPEEFFGGTKARGFVADLGAMKSQIFLPMVQGLKGMGALSDAEGKKLEASIGALDIGMPETEFRASVNRIIKDLTFYRERAAKGEAAGGAQPPTTEEEAPPGEESAAPAGEEPTAPPGEPGIGLQTTPEGKVILRDLSAGTVAGLDTGLVGEEGGTHTEVNPALAGSNATINAMLKDHAPAEEIAEYLKGKGASPESIAFIMSKVRDIREWQKGEGRGYAGDFNVDVERWQVPNTAAQSFMGSDVGAAGAASVDALTGFNMDTVAGLLGKDPAEVRAALQAGQAAHPKSALAGTIAGGTLAALGAETAAARAGVPAGIAPLAGDVGYGAISGAGATDVGETGAPATLGERAMGAVQGALGAGIGSAAGGAVAAAGRPSPNAATRALNEAGIPTTIGGQYEHVPIIGSRIKSTEDAIESIPLVKDSITARRMEGIEKFNEVSFNHALDPIGVKLPPGRLGGAGIEFAQEEVSKAFQKALAGREVVPDAKFAKDYTDAWNKAAGATRIGKELTDDIKEIVEPYMAPGNKLSGEDMQLISRELRELKADWRKEKAGRKAGHHIDEIEKSIFGLFERQHKDVIPAYNAAKIAQKRLYALNDAVLAADTRGGIFMPSQLSRADKAHAIKTGGRMRAGRTSQQGGGREFKDVTDAGNAKLPSKMPDSGTAGRLLIPAAALGLGAGGEAATGGESGGKLLTFGAILAGLYTKQGQRLLTKPGRGARSRLGKAVLGSEAVQRGAPAAGAAAGVTYATREERKRKKKGEK